MGSKYLSPNLPEKRSTRSMFSSSLKQKHGRMKLLSKSDALDGLHKHIGTVVILCDFHTVSFL